MHKKLQLFISLALLLTFSLSIQAQRLQAVHAISDDLLHPADVYISVSIITITLDDVQFRSATPMADVPFADIPINVGAAPGNSTSAADTLVNFITTLSSDITYIGVVRGLSDPDSYAPNPDGRETFLDFTLKGGVREQSSSPGMVDFIVAHTVTDAPAVDVVVREVGTLFNGLQYSDISDYASVAPGAYVIELKSPDGTMNYGAFDVDLTNWADSTFIITATGFLDPSQNQNGVSLGLNAFTPGGQILSFPSNPTAIDDDLTVQPNNYELSQNYPNPFNPETTISFNLAKSQQATLAVFNAVGQQIATLASGTLNAGQHVVTWNATDFPSGIYFYRLQTRDFEQTKKMILLK